jgi:hypothetical protein
VGIALTVENDTPRAIDLYLRGRTPTFDVIVARSDGVVVWRRLENDIIPAIVSIRTLAPAERLELSTLWDQRMRHGNAVAAGDYTVRGFLLVEGESLETTSVPLHIDGLD